MAAFDYEGAWRDLLVRLADKPQWGSRQLDEEMNAVLRRHALPDEPAQARLLRVYGVEVHNELTNQMRAPLPSPSGDELPGATDAARATDPTQEVDDDGSKYAGAGAFGAR